LQAATQEEEILEDYNVRNGASSTMSSIGSALPSISGGASEAGSMPVSALGLYDGRETGFGGAGYRSTSPTISQVSSGTLMPSPSSVSYSNHSNSKQGSRSARSHSGSSDRFAKQGAYRPPIEQRALNRVARDKREQQRNQALNQAPTSVAHLDAGNESGSEPEWEL